MPLGYKKCPECNETNRSFASYCKQCNYHFSKDNRSTATATIPKPITEEQPGMNSLVNTFSNASTNNGRETESDKILLQKAFPPGFSYLGKQAYYDINGKQIGNVTYNAYHPDYNDGEIISAQEIYMLVMKCVEMVIKPRKKRKDS